MTSSFVPPISALSSFRRCPPLHACTCLHVLITPPAIAFMYELSKLHSASSSSPLIAFRLRMPPPRIPFPLNIRTHVEFTHRQNTYYPMTVRAAAASPSPSLTHVLLCLSRSPLPTPPRDTCVRSATHPFKPTLTPRLLRFLSIFTSPLPFACLVLPALHSTGHPTRGSCDWPREPFILVPVHLLGETMILHSAPDPR